MSAVVAAKDVFTTRNVGTDQLPAAEPTLLPLDEAAEAKRAALVNSQFGAAFPGVVQNTTDVVTVTALIANGQVAQMPYHLNRALDNGLTQVEAAEAIAHLAFYVGWPNVFSAMPVAKEVFEKRPR